MNSAGNYSKAKNSPPKPLLIHDAPQEQINEQHLHHLWAEQSLKSLAMKTIDGKNVSVGFPGFWNKSDGPDFKEALIQLDNNMIKGDIEIHLYSSDWFRHKHEKDSRYNKVILHVAGWLDSDKKFVVTSGGKKVPQLILAPLLEKEFEEIDHFLEMSHYSEKNARFGGVGACSRLCLNPSFKEPFERFLEKAGEERLYNKANAFRLKRKDVGYDEILYEGIIGALGYHKNYLPFIKLAESVPLSLLRKILSGLEAKEAPLILQAIFLYQANLVPPSKAEYDKETNQYLSELHRAYCQVSLPDRPFVFWNLKGTRPANYPARRIAGMSRFLAGCLQDGLLNTLLRCYENPNPLSRLKEYFNTKDNDYWLRHATFGGKTLKKPMALVGAGTIQTIEVNVIIPILILYARETENKKLAESLVQRLKTYPPLPENYITKFMQYRLFADKAKSSREFSRTAFQQQALIQIYRDFCARGFEGCQSCGLVKWLSSGR
ncbi:MAG: DUF2851 family protein [Planctomycetes bacterium]|nr:DUF2851 family protein [Planctomycetota bacterium]